MKKNDAESSMEMELEKDGLMSRKLPKQERCSGQTGPWELVFSAASTVDRGTGKGNVELGWEGPQVS